LRRTTASLPSSTTHARTTLRRRSARPAVAAGGLGDRAPARRATTARSRSQTPAAPRNYPAPCCGETSSDVVGREPERVRAGGSGLSPGARSRRASTRAREGASVGGTRKCGAYIGPAEAAASARGWRPNSPPQDTGAATPDSLAATDRFIRQASYASLLALLPVCSASAGFAPSSPGCASSSPLRSPRSRSRPASPPSRSPGVS
jgi:hypothetical protein